MDTKEKSSFSARWGEGVASHGFTMVPNLLLEHVGEFSMTSTEFLVFMQIESYQFSKDRLPFPGIRTIAKRCGLDARTITRVITSLENKEFIVRHKRVGRSNQYDSHPIGIELHYLADYIKQVEEETADLQKAYLRHSCLG